MATFFCFNLPESSYEEAFDWEEFDGDFPEDASKNQYDSCYNYLLLYSIQFLVFFRLFILMEPFLSFILKFITIRYFILNEFLFVAYFISFLFIFSRFVFLLTDKTMNKWKISVKKMLEKEQETPKITKKNIEIMTHWSLRGLNRWFYYMYDNKKRNKIWVTEEEIKTLRNKFQLKTIKTKRENKTFKYILVFIVLIYIFFNILFIFFFKETTLVEPIFVTLLNGRMFKRMFWTKK